MGKREKQTFRTDRQLKALKPRSDWRDVWDELTPGLAVRVGPSTADGRFRRTFVVAGRFGGKSSARRRLGEYGPMTLEEAREKAREWRKLAARGIDPKLEAERSRRQREAENANTFGAVAERYIAEHLAKKRRGHDDAREIRNFLLKAWRDRPITEITPQDIKALIRPLGRRTPAQAHGVLGHIKRIFAWVLNDDIDYGVKQSPAALLKPKALIGERKVRTRVLDDREIAAFWRGTARLGYPMGDLYRLILLCGTRISEASDAQWGEFDFRERLWVVPSARFKSEQEHPIPLSDRALELLGRLPAFAKGDFLFSTTFGATPVNGFSKPKERLDRHMLGILRAMARKRGETPPTRFITEAEELDPSFKRKAGEIPRWTVHDLRRTTRTRMAELGVDDKFSEMILGHGRRGLSRVYDHAKHLPEMADALQLWAGRLGEIVGETPPTSSNVVNLETRLAR